MSLFLRKDISALQVEVGSDQSLKRALGPVNLVALGIGAIIGAGIFVLTGQAAANYAGPAIVYFDDSNDIANLTAGLFGDSLWAWGVWDLVIAALALFAGWSLLSNGPYGRIFAYLWAIVLIVNCFMIFQLAPWYAAAAIGLATLVIYGLAVSPRESAA